MTGPQLTTVYGQPSWRFATEDVEAYVTAVGGHLGPVTFARRGRSIQPYAIAPWAEEPTDPALPPILRVLRGDFFCLPFGGNATPYRGERHAVHGESANARWSFESLERQGRTTTLHLSLETQVRKGRLDKSISLVAGHQAVYCRHTVSAMEGPMCLGHHAMLKFPDRPGSGVVSTSAFVYGQVFPEPTERPENRGYSMLRPGCEFSSLAQVQTATGERTGLSEFPARRGYEDIAMLVHDATAGLAWTAVTFAAERYVWFALKDPAVLRHLVLWFSNGGRHYPPWNGRHVGVLGLEDVTANFHYGLAESALANPLTQKGYATCVQLAPDAPLVVNYIMGAAEIPAGFAAVADCRAEADGVALTSASGQSVKAAVDLGFLRGGSTVQASRSTSRIKNCH